MTGESDVTIAMDDENLLKLMTGQLSAQKVHTSILTVLLVLNCYHYNYPQLLVYHIYFVCANWLFLNPFATEPVAVSSQLRTAVRCQHQYRTL